MAIRTWVGTTSGDWAVTTNWVEGVVPVAGDDVYFTNNSVSVTASLNQSTVALNSLNIDQSYTGQIGAAGVTGAYLQIGATTANIGAPAAARSNSSGSTRLNLDFGSSAVTVNVINSSTTGADTGEPPVRIKGSAISAVNVVGGVIGIATDPDDSATVSYLRVGGAGSPNVYVGRNATVTETDVQGGTVIDFSNNATTTINVFGGTYSRNGNGGVTTLNAKGGTVQWNSSGTVAQANVAGTLDFSGNPRPKTVTNCTLTSGATLNCVNGVPNGITFTNPILLSYCDLSQVSIQYGNNYHVALSS